MRAFFEARREWAAILLFQTAALSPPLFFGRFSLFPSRPNNFFFSLSRMCAEKKSSNSGNISLKPGMIKPEGKGLEAGEEVALKRLSNKGIYLQAALKL